MIPLQTAADYLRETSLAMNGGYRDDCVTHACRIAELLLAEGRSPWIARLRDITVEGADVIHGPLIPQRFRNVAWTTHYIACCGLEAYDPITPGPVALDEYAQLVFGRPIPIETHLDATETERLLRSGEIRRTFRPAIARSVITERQ